MSGINLLFWVAGVALIAIGFGRAQGPWRRAQALEATDHNLRRYEAWRGKPPADAGSGPTGADVMRDLLRQQARNWLLVGAAGVVLVFIGFALR